MAPSERKLFGATSASAGEVVWMLKIRRWKRNKPYQRLISQCYENMEFRTKTHIFVRHRKRERRASGRSIPMFAPVRAARGSVIWPLSIIHWSIRDFLFFYSVSDCHITSPSPPHLRHTLFYGKYHPGSQFGHGASVRDGTIEHGSVPDWL